MHPYSPRDTRYAGVRRPGRWRLKVYGINWRPGDVDWSRFEPGLRLADDELPEPSDAEGRPGLGFIIAHQGRTGDYVVLAWWNSENELPLRVWVRRGEDERFRPARNGELVCVWDLEVIWAERQAWVKTMLGPNPSVDDYLAEMHPAGGA